MNQKPLFLAVTLVALLVIGAAFCLMSRRPVATNQSVVTKPVAEAPIQTEREKYPQHIEAIPGDTDEVWYNIPELGVRMKLNKEFAEDLVYVYRHERDDEGDEWDVIDISLKKLEQIAPGCGGYGLITKWGRDVQESAKNNNEYFFSGSNSIQIGEYYYVWTGSQDVCWNPSLKSEVRKVFPGKYEGTGAKNILEGMKTVRLVQ